MLTWGVRIIWRLAPSCHVIQSMHDCHRCVLKAYKMINESNGQQETTVRMRPGFAQQSFDRWEHLVCCTDFLGITVEPWLEELCSVLCCSATHSHAHTHAYDSCCCVIRTETKELLLLSHFSTHVSCTSTSRKHHEALAHGLHVQ